MTDDYAELRDALNDGTFTVMPSVIAALLATATERRRRWSGFWRRQNTRTTWTGRPLRSTLAGRMPAPLSAAPGRRQDVGDAVSFEVERADWMRSPGRTAVLTLGPFTFYVSTADGADLGFGITVGSWAWSWHVESLP